MEIKIIINDESNTIDILYDGYNIVSESIYSYTAVKKIIKILEDETKHIDTLKNIIDINKNGRW